MCAEKTNFLHVLVIDDSPLVAAAMEMALTAKGCKVAVAESGKDALKKLEQHQYDLIFSDINLGDMTGFDVARALRKKELGSDTCVPIIGMSTDDCKQKALAAGMDDFYKKPLSHELVAEILKAFT